MNDIMMFRIFVRICVVCGFVRNLMYSFSVISGIMFSSSLLVSSSVSFSGSVILLVK